MPDKNGFLLPGERQILLFTHAPVLVLFPESKEQAPYPDDGDAIYTLRSSYHPRSVEFFLKYAKLRYRRRLLLRKPSLLFSPPAETKEREAIRQSITREELQAAIDSYQHDPHYTGLGDADLRAAILSRLVQEHLGKRVRGLDLPYFRGHNLKQWRAYFQFLEETDPQTRRSVVYGRLVQGLASLDADSVPGSDVAGVSGAGPYDVRRNRVALQYWFQYYYDDWANRHEGDWESITILLELDPVIVQQGRELEKAELLAGVKGRDVGYASHEDGYRRLWEDVQKTEDGRPIVYVARGSSASYFAWKRDGYPTSARVGFVERLLAAPGALVRGRRIFGRRWDVDVRARFTGRDPKNTDWVAADPRPHDRQDARHIDPVERSIPLSCRGVRRTPGFGAEAGQDDATYHLEIDDIFWLEMVQEYGVQWGEDYFLPGTKGPGGVSKAQREKQRSSIHQLAKIEAFINQALEQLGSSRFVATNAIPELDRALRPLRPQNLRQEECFPPSIRSYVFTVWASILHSHPEAWPGGPGLFLRWIFSRQPKPGPMLAREDPLYHLKSLLAQVRRTRYERQNEGSKWDNPFGWTRYICRADTFYYGMAPSRSARALDLSLLDCVDVDMTVE